MEVPQEGCVIGAEAEAGEKDCQLEVPEEGRVAVARVPKRPRRKTPSSPFQTF